MAYACICNFGLFEDRIKEPPFIFTGKVLSVENIYSENNLEWPVQQKAKVVIKKKFKGNQNDTLTVFSDLHSCGYSFEKNGKYLVYAMHFIEPETTLDQNFINTNDKIVTGQCFGTKEVEHSENNIRLLEKLFSSKYSIEDISADKLYNEVWKNEFFIFVDDYPEFPEGSDSLSSFVQRNLKSCSLLDERPYDPWKDQFENDSLFNELNMGFESRDSTFAKIHFDVSKTGKLNNFRIDEYFSLNNNCNDEALRVAKLMSSWIPAKIKGIPVNTTHSIEIDFKSKSAH